MGHDQAQVALPEELPALKYRHHNDNECQATDKNISADLFFNRFASLVLEPQALKGAEGEDQEAYQKRAKALSHRGSYARGRARDIGALLFHRHGGPCDTADADLWLATALPFVADAAELVGLSAFAEGLAWARSHCPAYVQQVGMLPIAETIDEILDRRDAAERNRHEANRTWVRWLPDMSELVTILRPTWTEVTGLGLRGWRCIDRPGEEELKARAAMQKQERRRAEGVRPQSERTKTRDLATLATELGKSLRTLERWSATGILDAKVEALRNVGKASAPYSSLSNGQISDTATNDNVEPADAPPSLIKTGFQGRNVTLSPAIVAAIAERHPHLVPDLRAHLEDAEADMNRVPERNRLAVVYNRLKSKHRAVSRAATIAAKAGTTSLAAA